MAGSAPLRSGRILSCCLLPIKKRPEPRMMMIQGAALKSLLVLTRFSLNFPSD